MESLFRFPLHIQDESDSDAEEFVPQTKGRQKSSAEENIKKTLLTSTRKTSTRKTGASMQPTSKTSVELPSRVLQPGFSQLDAIPMAGTRAAQKRVARLERAKTTGASWFNMRAPEMTEEVQQNLEVLQMRSAIDKGRVYKKNDMRVLPKYFQMGTVVETAADFYSSRIPKKQRRKTLVEELMADMDAKRQLKKQAAKSAVKKQLQAQRPAPKKKRKPFKKRNRDLD